MDGEGGGTLWLLVALAVGVLGLVIAWVMMRQKPKRPGIRQAEAEAVKQEYRDQNTR